MKNLNSKNIKLARKSLQQLGLLLAEEVGMEIHYGEDDIHGVYSVLTSHATIFYTVENNHFYVTFPVGSFAHTAAKITKLVGVIFKYNEFTVLEDSFFDIAQERLIFGIEALDKKQESVRESAGQSKCPVCEGVYAKKYFKDGFCLNCETFRDQIIYH